MKKVLLSITVLVLFLFSTIAVVDAQTVNKAFDVRPDGWLTLNSEFGMIDVKATNRNRVDVVFTKSLKRLEGYVRIGGLTNLEIDRLGQEALADFEPTFEKTGSNVVITGKFRRGREYWMRRSQHISLILSLKAKIEFQVMVPRRYNLDLNTSSNDIAVSDLDGALKAQTSIGDLRFGEVKGVVWGRTSSGGTITLQGCQNKVDVKTSIGNIDLGNIEGPVKAETSSGGNILLQGCQNKVDVKTSIGNIDLGNIEGPVKAETSSGGNILLQGCQNKVDVKTSIGNINLGNVAGNVKAKTASGGDIQVGNVGGTVNAETSIGNLRFGQVKGAVWGKTSSGGTITLQNCQGKVDMKTSLGDIHAEMTTQPRQQWALQTTSGGKIVVKLISNIAVLVDAQTSSSGRVSSEFPVQGSISKNSLKGTINGGGPLLKLRTSIGDIRLLRKGR